MQVIRQLFKDSLMIKPAAATHAPERSVCSSDPSAQAKSHAMSKYPLPAALAPASEKDFVTGDVVKCKAEALPKSLRGKEMQVIRQLF